MGLFCIVLCSTELAVYPYDNTALFNLLELLHYTLISGTISPLALFTFSECLFLDSLHIHIEFMVISFPISIYTKNKKKPKACYNSD